MKNRELRLRAHHGMCFAYFRGEGYSGEFTAHMGQMQKALQRNPLVTLAEEADDVCARCPNLCGGVCKEAEKVRRYDRRVLELCGLRTGDPIEWEAFAELVRARILETGRREAICGDCQWNALCLEQAASPTAFR